MPIMPSARVIRCALALPTSKTKEGGFMAGTLRRSPIRLLVGFWILSCLAIPVRGQGLVVISVAGQTFKLIRDLRKTLNVAMNVVVEQGVYGSLYQEFVSGALDLDQDRLDRLPRWNGAPGVGSKLIQSEITLQVKMVYYLETQKGVRGRAMESMKQTLFAQQEAFEVGNRDEGFFNQLRSQRRMILRLK